MKRLLLLVALAGVLGMAAGVRAQSTAAAEQALPVRNVVLFSSGVGYFGRAGRINGAANVPLSFRAEQINDVLKSLVLFDATGGVRPATYTAKDSLARRLKTLGVAVNSSATLGTLLRQFQGARVRVELVGDEAVEGRILGVNLKNVTIKDGGTTTIEVLNLLTDKGLRAISLEQVTQIRLLDDRLDRELRQSLELMATGLDDQRRTIELHFDGKSTREVRAGYLLEMPVWKTTYRLVLDSKDKNAKPYLQGWAIVENTTDDDWNNVQLSLVSGRPVSFIQDLYQPLYVPRPVVQPQIIGSPLPQTYGESLEEAKPPSVATAPSALRRSGAAGYLDNDEAGARGPQGAPGPPGPAGKKDEKFSYSEFAARASDRREDIALSAQRLAQSVAAQAQGAERGELFEYAIAQPVTLPKQQAAMVPIVGENIGGEKLSIFDASSSVTHALNGFRLKNTTGLHLSGGPVTVFEDGVYAGDAQITNLQPNEDRLISYAVDLNLVVSREQPQFRQDVVSVSAKSGVLYVKHNQRRELVYTFRNKSDAAKTVLVQQQVEPDFKLIEPLKPDEKTANGFRFKVEVPAKKTASLKVVTERPVMETIALLNMDFNLLVNYARNTQVSEKLRAALQELVARRRKITDLQQQIAKLQTQIQEIDQEQSRIRQNMDRLSRDSALYKRYEAKLNAQETQVEKLREEVALARDAEVEAQKELRAFVDTLTVE